MAYRDELAEKFDGALKDGLTTFLFTMYGPRAASVEGAKRIIYYDDNRVKFAVGRRVLEVSGKDLRITSCAAGEYYVAGEIRGVEVSE
ncbi:MAG TPA: YabP/YqfC family sporulation protein [Candidatus Ornithoclostridium faecavium]|nr:YabP/YqfC family sporulation protein [Candidatus Ornithoclostridium faecavium]